jgi:hypothetical protein
VAEVVSPDLAPHLEDEGAVQPERTEDGDRVGTDETRHVPDVLPDRQVARRETDHEVDRVGGTAQHVRRPPVTNDSRARSRCPTTAEGL